jgi:hypothetical protein
LLVPTYEDSLLAVLEKIGQPQVSAAAPAVLDADDASADYVETAGPSEDPNEEAVEAQEAPIDPAGIPAGLAPITRKNLFVHHDTHPVTFDLALLAEYGTDWFDWEPSTLWKEIKEDFHVPSISDHACAKIQAVRTLHINEWFWDQWEVFCWITQALNNNIPDFHVIQKPSAAQIVNAVDVATMVRDGEEFNQEVQSWVAASMVDDGIFYAPEPITFCQDEILELLTEMKVEKPTEVIAAVRKRFKEVMSLPEEAWGAGDEPILKETVVDIQVAKLKVACDYLALRRRQLKDQLRLLQ